MPSPEFLWHLVRPSIPEKQLALALYVPLNAMLKAKRPWVPQLAS